MLLTTQQQKNLQAWIDARHHGDLTGEDTGPRRRIGRSTASEASASRAGRPIGRSRKKTNDADYVFITFILDYLPHGLIGLLIAAFFAAALSSKAAELNALASTTMIDIYRHVIQTECH